MRVNHIKALDYQIRGNDLILTLAETTLEAILGMEAELLRIQTDEGDPVEAFAGFRLARVNYDPRENTFTAVFDREKKTNTATALDALAAENLSLKAQVQAQQTQLDDQVDALIELAELLAGEEEG